MLYKDNYLAYLIHSAKNEWEEMMNHKFVKEIGNGNLKEIYFIKTNFNYMSEEYG